MKKIVMLTSLSFCLQFTYAQFGELDPLFGDKGVVKSGYDGFGYTGIAVQDDGKIVVAGSLRGDFALVRYNSDGTFDNTFSGDGKLTTDFGSSEDKAMAVAIQKDGKIVVVGYTTLTTNEYDFAIARYNVDGSADLSFSIDGKQTTDFGSTYNIARSVAIEGNGKIVVAGETVKNSTFSFAIAKYNTDGSLDNSFSADGIQTIQVGNYSIASSATVQNDGKIVVAGWAKVGAEWYAIDFTVVRFNNDGTLDNTFDGDGIQTADFGYYEIGTSMAIQSDGKIVIAGRVVYYPVQEISDFAIVRFNTDGSLDKSFSKDGKQTTDFGLLNGYDEANAVVSLNNGKIVVAGYSGEPDNGYHFGLAGYNNDGTPDNTFSGDGEQITNISQTDIIYGLAIADDKLYAAGNAGSPASTAGFLARYLVDTGKRSMGVSIIKPLNNSSYTEPAAIDIAANATAFPENTISSVEFYNGSELLFTDYAIPYTFSWSKVPAGNYVLTAKATDNEGHIATSAPISVTVVEDKAPTVSIKIPIDNASYLAPASINITAQTIDNNPGGIITKLEFYNGTELLYTDDTDTSPYTYTEYTYTWNSVPEGDYILTAKATDNNGLVGISLPIHISVVSNPPPKVKITSPVEGATYTARATIILSADATDEDGKVTTVDFYNGTKLIFTEYYPPFYRKWYNVKEGDYTITAKAADNNGNITVSDPVHITVLPSTSPSVNITSPGNGTTFAAPADIFLRADAIVPNGTISKVDFYNGNDLVLTEYKAPYGNKWRGVPAGNYSFTAKVTDGNGNVITSQPVAVTVTGALSRSIVKEDKPNLSERLLRLNVNPNPVANVLNISVDGLNANSKSVISLISVSGVVMKVIQSNTLDKTVKLDVSSLSAGVYFMKFINGDKFLYKQFVKL